MADFLIRAENGKSIEEVRLKERDGLTSTYEVMRTDGVIGEFTVTDGKDGKNAWIKYNTMPADEGAFDEPTDEDGNYYPFIGLRTEATAIKPLVGYQWAKYIPEATGTVVKVGGTKMEEIGFTSDPQTQIDTLQFYDIVIRTQEQFNDLVASSTWKGAKSVALVGNGGTLRFTRSGSVNLVVPSTVKNISGFNGATIYFSSFNSTLNPGRALAGHKGCAIKNMTIALTRTDGKNAAAIVVGFSSVINCTAKSTHTAPADRDIRGFYDCQNLVNCTAEIISPRQALGFFSCRDLVNCSARCYSWSVTVNESSGAIGFSSCHRLANCSSYAGDMWDESGRDNAYSVGFLSCSSIVNCSGVASGGQADYETGYTVASGDAYGMRTCSRVTNCEISAHTTNNGVAIMCHSCSFLNGINGDARIDAEDRDIATVALWSGTTTFRDDETCKT